MTRPLAEIVKELDELYRQSVLGVYCRLPMRLVSEWPRLSEELTRLKRANERLREGLVSIGHGDGPSNWNGAIAREALADADKIERG